MSRIGIVLLAGVIAGAAVPCRADETTDNQASERIIPVAAAETAPVQVDVPGPGPSTEPGTPLAAANTEPVAPSMEPVAPAPADCMPEAHGCGGLGVWISQHAHGCHCARRFWEWLTYYPQSCPRWCSHCGCTCAPTCVPPLYTYFLWHCHAAGCGGPVAHHAPAPATAEATVTEGTVTMGMVSEGTATQPTAPEGTPPETTTPAPQ